MTRADERNPDHDPHCRVCALVTGREPELVVAPGERFQLVSLPGPVPIPGWVMLCARRHVAGPGFLDDAEADAYGRVLRHTADVVRRETGALRIYVAALGEADPHFHTHLVPRMAETPEDRKGFALFELQRLAQQGAFEFDERAHRAMLERLREAFTREPIPR